MPTTHQQPVPFRFRVRYSFTPGVWRICPRLWWRRQDSNLRPSAYEAVKLPTALRRYLFCPVRPSTATTFRPVITRGLFLSVPDTTELRGSCDMPLSRFLLAQSGSSRFKGSSLASAPCLSLCLFQQGKMKVTYSHLQTSRGPAEFRSRVLKTLW